MSMYRRGGASTRRSIPVGWRVDIEVTDATPTRKARPPLRRRRTKYLGKHMSMKNTSGSSTSMASTGKQPKHARPRVLSSTFFRITWTSAYKQK